MDDPDLKALAGRLHGAVKRAGGNAVVAQKSGIPQRSLANYLSGEIEPKVFALSALADACHVSLDWLMRGGHLPEMPEIASQFSFVRRYDVRASAGNGSITINESAADIVAFRSDWLRRIGINPRHARAMFAHGDSMEPTINDGDLLLIDESIDCIVDHGIYVVVYQGMVLLKRVQKRLDGTLLLKSDNTLYEVEIVSAVNMPELRVAGRVRWYGKTI